jgi:hypothetical protein
MRRARAHSSECDKEDAAMMHDMHHQDHDHGGPADQHHGDPEEAPKDFHGMLVVGEEIFYLSHLPMFDHSNHDIQAILEVTFTNEGSDPQADYANDRKETQTRTYTLAPEEEFFLPEVVSTDPAHPPRRSFTATIYQGHFEKGGTPVASAVVNVVNVVHFRKFDPHAQELPQLRYLLFGKRPELFLAHWINKAPDFDQVLPVRVAGREFTEDELRRGVPVVVPSRANSLSERLRQGDRVTAEAQLAGAEDPESVEIQLEAGTELYFEEGELRVPHVMAQTEEERAAGFR